MTLSSNAWEASNRVSTVGETLLEKNVLSIQFTEDNLDSLKLEEEYQILELTKTAGKGHASRTDILANQFGGGNETPEKLEYLDPETSGSELEASATSEGQEEQTYEQTTE